MFTHFKTRTLTYATNATFKNIFKMSNYLILLCTIIICLIVRSQSAPYLNEYLVHYWPLDNSDMSDFVGNANMFQGVYTNFTSDRFGNLNSALSLNGGYTQVTSGYFFDTPQFTISAWVYPDQLGLWSRVIDFGNGYYMDNIVLALTSFSSAVPDFLIFDSSARSFDLYTTTPLINNKWQFLTATFNSNTTTALIYMNGVLQGNISTNYHPAHILRSNNYIGQSNFKANGDGYSYSYLDDLRFYNVSLSQSQVVELMTSQDPSKQVDLERLSYI